MFDIAKIDVFSIYKNFFLLFFRIFVIFILKVLTPQPLYAFAVDRR